MPKGLLEGVKVADFTWIITGPVTTKTFADCGAEVIKIEGRSRVDFQRTTPPFKDGVVGVDRCGNFAHWNTGKLSLALNLGHPRGIDVAKKVVGWADIVVENFAGGTMERMGLGYDVLRKVKPDIIMLSSCMQGQTGPYATHPGTGFQLTAMCGFSQIAGWPDRPPLFVGPFTDFLAPHFNVLVALAALDYRRRTGKGQYIDMAQYENGVHFIAPALLDYAVNQRIAGRMGNRSARAAPHGVYRCQGDDRWCAIAAFTDEERRSFCAVIGDPPWTGEPRFAAMPGRKEGEEEMDRLIERWTINHSAETIMGLMQAAGVAAGVVATGEDLMERDPQLRHRRFFRKLEHPDIGEYRAPGPPFQTEKVPHGVRRAPLLGEHNEYVLKDLLKLSDEQIAELVIEGVVE